MFSLRTNAAVAIGVVLVIVLGTLLTPALCLATDEPTASAVSLMTDAAGLFNERGYARSNSFSSEANDAINDFNGNLSWVKRLDYLPLSQQGVHADIQLTYNGSVGHTIRTSIANMGCVGSQQNINLPEWIMSLNGIALQTFNFENEAITWETSGKTDTALDHDVAALIEGYHSCYTFQSDPEGYLRHHGTISILTGDGGVRQFISSSASWDNTVAGKGLLLLGEYRSLSKEDRAVGWVDSLGTF